MDPDKVHEYRTYERDAEYAQRVEVLSAAAQGKPPSGVDPRAPGYGGKAFVASLQDVDVDKVLAAVAHVHEHGYAIVPLLSAESVLEVRAAMEPLFDGTRRLFGRRDTTLGTNQTVHVQNVLAKSDRLDGVASNATLRAIIAGILGYDFVFNAGAVAMSPDPGCDAQQLHRDDGFFPLIPRPHLPLVVTVALALDDFTKENGGTQIVPGSCCWPPERQPQPSEISYCEMPAGSMLIWDGALFHGGGANQSDDQPRRTLTFNYTRGWLRTQFNQYLSIPRSRILAMPPALQADVGYRRSAIGLGGCDLQDPLGYLQRLEAAGGDGQQPRLGAEFEE